MAIKLDGGKLNMLEKLRKLFSYTPKEIDIAISLIGIILSLGFAFAVGKSDKTQVGNNLLIIENYNSLGALEQSINLNKVQRKTIDEYEIILQQFANENVNNQLINREEKTLVDQSINNLEKQAEKTEQNLKEYLIEK